MTIRYEEEAKRSLGERMHVYILYNGMVSMLFGIVIFPRTC